MSETDNKPTLGRKPLGLKRSVEAGEVKQTFSHGRTNKVVVEVKRRKLIGKPGEAQAAPAPEPVAAPPPPPAAAVAEAPKPAPARRAASETRQEMQARLLREAEEARLTALEAANRREQEERLRALEDEKRRAEDNRKAEAEAAAAPASAARAAAPPKRPPPPSRSRASRAEAAPPSEAAPAANAAAPAPRRFTPVAAPKRPEPRQEARPSARQDGGDDRRQSGKLTVTRALNEDEGARARSLAALKRAREKEKRAHFAGQSQPREKQVRDVVVPEAITVQELANRMAEKGADLVKALFKMGMMVTVNQTIDQDTAELLVEEFGHNITRVSESDVDIDTAADVDDEATLQPRPPVVTIMGHVDHGKTSAARRAARHRRGDAARPAASPSISAPTRSRPRAATSITFLDTPGHEAFTEMRMRGANVTDIVILVVAADDGLMPQTIEAINHTKAAGVPMIVAITKSDKPEANAQKIRERLLEHEIIVEADVGRRPGRRSLGQDRRGARRADREDPAPGRAARTDGQPRSQRRSHGDRGQARQGQGSARDRADQPRHAQGRRHLRGRHPVGPRPRDASTTRAARSRKRRRRCRSKCSASAACRWPAIR